MAKKLCIIVSASVVEVEEGPPVIVIELLGGDRWGCHPETPIHVAGRNNGCTTTAGELYLDMRIWLDIPALIKDGSFVTAAVSNLETN